jgi:rare lipoprotein A
LKYLILIILSFIFLNNCASSSRFAAKKQSKSSTNVRDGEVLVGYSSYYAYKYHGKKTANGEIFNMHDYTAAHRNLPFGTILLVTNLDNGKSVKVRINDRGPYVAGRILDLSLQAAKDIGLIKTGVAKVNIKILKLGDND